MLVFIATQNTKPIRVKFTTDIDCCPPDALHVRRYEYAGGIEEVMADAHKLETAGYVVCVDTEAGLYETGEQS